MNNVIVKRYKPPEEPKIPYDNSKYKELIIENSNLPKVFKEKILKLSEEERSDLMHIKCYEIFYYESNYEHSKTMSFKRVDVDKIIKEFSELSSLYPELNISGTLMGQDDEGIMDKTILRLSVANGQVTVLV